MLFYLFRYTTRPDDGNTSQIVGAALALVALDVKAVIISLSDAQSGTAAGILSTFGVFITNSAFMILINIVF